MHGRNAPVHLSAREKNIASMYSTAQYLRTRESARREDVGASGLIWSSRLPVLVNGLREVGNGRLAPPQTLLTGLPRSAKLGVHDCHAVC